MADETQNNTDVTDGNNSSGEGQADTSLLTATSADNNDIDTDTSLLTDDKTDDENTDRVEDVPETYEAFTMPEGMTLDENLNGKFVETAKEFGLSQEKAQKLVNLAAEHSLQLANKQVQEWGNIRNGWKENIKKDPDFGGQHFSETLQRAQRTLKKFGSPELTSFLSQGYGDNPEIIKLLAKIDKSGGDDKLEGDSQPNTNGATKLPYQIMYGN